MQEDWQVDYSVHIHLSQNETAYVTKVMPETIMTAVHFLHEGQF